MDTINVAESRTCICLIIVKTRHNHMISTNDNDNGYIYIVAIYSNNNKNHPCSLILSRHPNKKTCGCFFCIGGSFTFKSIKFLFTTYLTNCQKLDFDGSHTIKQNAENNLTFVFKRRTQIQNTLVFTFYYKRVQPSNGTLMF